MMHTPTPWHIGVRTSHSKRDVYGQHGELIALADAVFINLATAQANAAFIVRACNSHDDLLAALERLVAHLSPFMGQGNLDNDIKQARAAINKAKGL